MKNVVIFSGSAVKALKMKITQRLGDPNNSSKCYWSLLKILLKEKKIPCVSLYFMVINILLTFKEKVRFSFFFFEIFNLLTNVLRFQTEAFYPLNYHYIQIAYYLLVFLQKMTSLNNQ